MIHIYDYNHLAGHLSPQGEHGRHKSSTIVAVDDHPSINTELQPLIGKFVRIDTSSGHYYYGLVTKQTACAVYLSVTPTATCYHPTKKVIIQKKEIVAVLHQEA